MKPIRTFLVLAMVGLATGFAQDGFDPLGEVAEEELPKMVRVQVEFIEVPHETMTELLYGPRKSANDTELRDKLQVLMKTGEAKILETQMETARSGQRANSEAFQEYLYPTEYDPGGFPLNVTGEEIAASIFAKNPAIPWAFETKSVGSFLEIEPYIDVSGKIIDLRFLPELIYHTGNVIWTEISFGGNTFRIEMPNFYKISINTSAALISGQPFLAGAVSPKDLKGDPDFSKKVLIFVRADVLTAGR